MKIFGASITDTVQTFLHAGYISANPRTWGSYMYPDSDPTIQLDVQEALRLKTETFGTYLSPHTTDSLSASMANIFNWPLLLTGVLCFFGVLTVWYLLRDRLRGKWRLAPPLLIPLAAFLILNCEDQQALPSKIPWEGATIEEYAHPEDATTVLLHGIIADGIINVGQPISGLENIQNEVSLPLSTLTKGEQYALKTYGLDGWGREFRLVKSRGEYVVTSAGSDGVFDNPDDMELKVSQCNDSSWDNNRYAFFIQKNNNNIVVAFHRWSGEFFKYNNKEDAKTLTGSTLFDFLPLSEFHDEQRQKIESTTTQFSSNVTYDPLILQVF